MAAGYRLSGGDLEYVYCRHLYGNDRTLTAWPGVDHAVVLAVGPHDRSSTDVYDILLGALDLAVPDDERNKPPCCDEDGAAPTDTETASIIVDAVEALARRCRHP